MARMFGQRPSAFLGLPHDSWEAYEVDRACMVFSLWIDSKLAERDRKGKPIYTLQALLRDDFKESTAFQSMKSLAVKKMSIPSSGVW